MVTIGGAQGGDDAHKIMRVKTGTESSLAHLMMVKRQVDFQIDLLEGALDLYMRAQAKKQEAQVTGEFAATLQEPGGGRVGQTVAQELSASTGGQEKAIDKLITILSQSGNTKDAALLQQGDPAILKKYVAFLEMQTNLNAMREQMGKLTGKLGLDSSELQKQSIKGKPGAAGAQEGEDHSEEMASAKGKAPLAGMPPVGKGKDAPTPTPPLSPAVPAMQGVKESDGVNNAGGIGVNWQSDPAAWTIWMLDWLVSSRILPGAYAEVNLFAQMANLHNMEMGAVNDLNYLLERMQNMKTAFTPKYLWDAIEQGKTRVDVKTKGGGTKWVTYHWKNKSFWTKGRIDQLYKEIEPLLQLLDSLDQDILKYGNDPNVGSLFHQLKSDLLAKIGAGGAMMGGHMSDFLNRIKNAYHDLGPNGSGLAGAQSALFANNGGGKFTTECYDWGNMVNAPEFFTTKTANGIKQKKNTKWWQQAINNIGPSGPWANVINDFKQLGNKLTNLSTTDQTNLRTAFFALTTKVNACSDLLTTTGQMMSAIAQNVRASG